MWFFLTILLCVCKIYEGICSCSANYIGETKRNVETRWNEHENPNKDSEPAKHLRKFPDHKFDWKILLTAPTNAKLRNLGILNDSSETT